MTRYFAPLALTLLLAACGTDTDAPDSSQPTTAPDVTAFVANPSTITAGGQDVVLSWGVSGTYDSLQLTDSFGQTVNIAGTSYTVYPTQSTTYRLTATNEAGSDFMDTTVTLRGDTSEPPTPPAPPAPPENPNPPAPPENPTPPAPPENPNPPAPPAPPGEPTPPESPEPPSPPAPPEEPAPPAPPEEPSPPETPEPPEEPELPSELRGLWQWGVLEPGVGVPFEGYLNIEKVFVTDEGDLGGEGIWLWCLDGVSDCENSVGGRGELFYSAEGNLVMAGYEIDSGLKMLSVDDDGSVSENNGLPFFTGEGFWYFEDGTRGSYRVNMARESAEPLSNRSGVPEAAREKLMEYQRSQTTP